MMETIKNKIERNPTTEWLLWAVVILQFAVIWKFGDRIAELKTRLTTMQDSYAAMKQSITQANEQANAEIRKYLKN